MRAVCSSNVRAFSTVAALLLAACGSPANNSALFAAGGGASVTAGAGSGEANAGSASTSSGGSSSGASSIGGGAGAHPSSMGGSSTTDGGGPNGGGSNGGGSNGGTPGAGGGGMPGAGGMGFPDGGSGGGPATGGGGATGSGFDDCSSLPNNPTYDSDNRHCYLAVHDLATFAVAKTHCTSLGAHLVTLSNSAENAFVWSLDESEHWIGATDGKGPKETAPGAYTWVDGEPFAYTDWSQGQPNASASTCPDNNSGGGTCYEHCGFQWTGGAMPGEWNDRLCAHMIDAICEWDG